MDDIEETKTDELSINPLLYYQKPEIGSNRRSDENFVPPIQVALPDGGVGIGLSILKPIAHEEIHLQNDAIILSGPENADIDNMERRSLKVVFLSMAIVNFILTSILFFSARTVDPSLVEVLNSETPSIFQQISATRTATENWNYAGIIIVLFIGALSVIFESALGVSAYCLSVMLNFILSTSALPYFVFSSRYVLDLAMLYFALVFRTKIMFTFLPTHVHRQ